MSFQSQHEFEYKPVHKDSEDESQSPFTADEVPYPNISGFQNSEKLWNRAVITIICVSVGFFIGCGVTYAILTRREHLHEQSATYETGFETEFTNAASSIELTRVRFTSGLDFDEDGNLYRIDDAVGPTYVGSPTPEIDKAWEDLIHDRYIAVNDEEAAEIGGGIYLNPETGIQAAGVSVLHTLHCLNEIRKGLYRDSYPVGNQTWGVLHVDHCIDHVRQYIQCHGDMTALPVQWSISANVPNPNFLQLHTCRNFQKLRAWATLHNKEVQSAVRAAKKEAKMANQDVKDTGEEY